jgi:hypothetical protein
MKESERKTPIVSEHGNPNSIDSPHWRKVRSLAEKPRKWNGLSDEQLTELVFLKCVDVGNRGEDSDWHILETLYPVFEERFEPEERITLYTQIQANVEKGHAGIDALSVFIYNDSSPILVSTASLDFACMAPLDGADELSGPKHLRRVFLDIPKSDTRAAITAGLLALGDRRVHPIIEECWRDLSLEAKREVWRWDRPYGHAATAEFLLTHLEQEKDEGVFGGLAAALMRVARDSRDGIIREIRRRFPVDSTGPELPVDVLAQWNVEEYGRMLEPRLRSLLLAEESPKVLPHVMEAWGISREEIARLEIRDCADRLRDSVSPDGRYLVEPVLGADFVGRAAKPQPLVAWGFFNPFGPTLSGLWLLDVPETEEKLVSYQTLNPFNQSWTVYGLLPRGAETTMLGQMLGELFARNGSSEEPLLGSLPTHILHPDLDVEYELKPVLETTAIRVLFSRAVAQLEADQLDFTSQCDLMRRFWASPWERTKHEVRSALPEADAEHHAMLDNPFAIDARTGTYRFIQPEYAEELKEKFRGEGRDDLVHKAELAEDILRRNRPAPPGLDQAAFDEWFDLVTHPEHVAAEAREMRAAWDGAIQFNRTGGGEMTALEWPL